MADRGRSAVPNEKKGWTETLINEAPPVAARTTTEIPTKKPAPRMGLSVATALVMGSIIGVGIFNLPTSLSFYGPISLVSMGLTTVGAVALALLFASLSRRL